MALTAYSNARRAVKRLQTRVSKTGLVKSVQEMSNRRRAESPFFQAYPARFNEKDVEGRLFVSHEDEYMFLRIPKAANTSVVASLMANRGGDYDSISAVEQFKKSTPRVSEMAPGEVADTVKRYFKFTLVRDPYSRLLSAYLDKVRRNKREAVHVHDFLGHRGPEPVSLDGFLHYLEQGEGWRDDAHWARQTDLMGLPVSELDEIGRFEHISDDLPRILQRIFGAKAKSHKAAPHATKASDKLGALTSGQLAKIFRIYEQDFDLLKYPRYVS